MRFSGSTRPGCLFRSRFEGCCCTCVDYSRSLYELYMLYVYILCGDTQIPGGELRASTAGNIESSGCV